MIFKNNPWKISLNGGGERKATPAPDGAVSEIHFYFLYLLINFSFYHLLINFYFFYLEWFRKISAAWGQGGEFHDLTVWRVTGKRFIVEQRRGNAPKYNVFYNIMYFITIEQRRGNAPNYNIFYNIMYL